MITLGEAIVALEEGKKVEFSLYAGEWYTLDDMMLAHYSYSSLRDRGKFRLAEPEQTKRTAREWLTDLPEEIQAELPEEGHEAWQHPDSESESLSDAMLVAFNWGRTDQGYKFWSAVYASTQGEQPYPVKVTRTVTPAELAGRWVKYGDEWEMVISIDSDGWETINVDDQTKNIEGYADTPNGGLKPFTTTDWDLYPEEEK